MKYVVIFLVLIGFTGFVIPQIFGTGENLFYGTAIFERLPVTISPNTEAKFEIKFQYTKGTYSLNNVTAIADITPQGAASFVHFNAEPFDVYQNSIARIPVTISIDPDIEYEKIFLNISYVGTGINDVQFKSSWSDFIIFDIAPKEKSLPPCTSDRTACFNRDANICDPGGWECGDAEDIFNVVIDSPLKQIKSGIKFHNVECNEGLVLAQRGNSERSVCVTLDTKIELTIRGWADDDRILLGCIGERVQKCYPEDKDEYRKKLQRYYYGFNEEPDFKIDVMCMTLETSKDTATFFKIPSYLPEGYSFKCSFSGTPYESYLIFDNKKVPDGWISHYPELVSDGAIFIHQTDEKRFVGEKKFATYGSATQRIQDTYDEVMLKNPSLQPQLIRINGMLAYAVDSCSDCGVQTANFTDGTIIQKSTSTEAKIKFIDENGTSYLLKAGIPLNELIKVAESLQ